MEELKPCPFCGGEATLITRMGDEIVHRIECTVCLAQMGETHWAVDGKKGKLFFEKENDAIKAWNRRADDGRA